MKIVVDTRVLGRGNVSGVEEYTRHMVDALLQENTGDQYEFFSSGLSRAPLPENWIRENTSVRVWGIPNRFLDASIRLLGMPHIEPRDADVVFSPHFNALPKPRTAKRVITFHDLSFLHFPEFYPARKRFWHWLQGYKTQAREADMLVAVSEFTRRDLMSAFGLHETKVRTVYSGVNPFYRKLAPDDPKHVAMMRDWRLARPFLLFVGTLEPRKNISGLIRAFDVVKSDPYLRELRLVIAGKRGWLCDTIFRDAARAKWKDDIIFWGEASHEELRILYNLAEAFVYPSFFEGFGFPPLEAQACGTSVITSNRSSLPEIVRDSALLVDPWKVGELADAIRMLLKGSALKERLINKGSENVKRFTWKAAARSLRNIFSELS